MAPLRVRLTATTSSSRTTRSAARSSVYCRRGQPSHKKALGPASDSSASATDRFARELGARDSRGGNNRTVRQEAMMFVARAAAVAAALLSATLVQAGETKPAIVFDI